MEESAGGEGLGGRARRALALIGASVLVLAGSAGTYLWRSADHPYSGPPPPQTSRPVLVTMAATSERQAWVLVHDSGGPESFLFHTQDGGAHWGRQLSVNGVAMIRFADSRRGVLVNYQTGSQPEAAIPRVFATTDAGDHWRPVAMPRLSLGFSGHPFFLDPDRGWVLGIRPPSGGAPIEEEYVLWRTSDGGRLWERLVSVDATQASDHGVSGRDVISGISFGDSDAGWMVTLGQLGSLAVYATRDGGHEWTRSAVGSAPPGAGAEDWFYPGPPLVSRNGSGMIWVFDRELNQTFLLRTSDGGNSWAEARPAPPAGGLLTVGSVSGAVAWVVGGSRAWVTADSGRSWAVSGSLPGGLGLGAVAPVDASIAWVQGRSMAADSNPTRWTLFRTTDAGRHWNSVTVPSLS